MVEQISGRFCRVRGCRTADLPKGTGVSGERLDAEWVRGWCERTSAALGVLMSSFSQTHGFPPDENAVTLATDASHQATESLVDLTPIPSDLTTLYWVLRSSRPSRVSCHSPDTSATTGTRSWTACTTGTAMRPPGRVSRS
jgi:hypothetical protein